MFLSEHLPCTVKSDVKPVNIFSSAFNHFQCIENTNIHVWKCIHGLNKNKAQRGQWCVLWRLFHFSIFFNNFFFFSLSSSLLHPRPSFLLLVLPSSSSLLPPCPIFLLDPLFFIIQHCLNHLESVKVNFFHRRIRPLIEMRMHLKTQAKSADNFAMDVTTSFLQFYT